MEPVNKYLLKFCIILLIAVPAFAATDEELAAIEEIIVTATHRETQLMDTPAAISAISGDFIEQIGATNMESLFKMIPGLNMTEGASTSNNRFVVRGVSSQTGTLSYAQTFSAVSVYIDDIPMTSAQGPARQFGGNLFDIKRVEVLKGPQGTLFGEGSVGGTIRYIQNQPELGETAFKIRTGLSDMNKSGDTGNKIEGMLNLPLGDQAAIRIMAFHNETPGWIDKTNTDEKDVNSEEANGGRIAFLWTPNERLTLDAGYYRSEVETNGSIWANSPYEESENIRIPGVKPGSNEDVDLFSLNLEYEFDWATLKLFSSYMDRKSNTVSENPQTVASLFDWFIQFNVAIRAPDDGYAEFTQMALEGWQFTAFDACSVTCISNQNAFNNNSTAGSERTTLEARLLSNTDGPLLWTAGVFYKQSDDWREDFQPFTFFSFLDDADFTYSVYEDFYNDPANSHLDKFEEFSVYGELTWVISDQWEATVGTRYTDMEQALEESATKFKDKVWSPKFGVAWRPQDDLLIYLNISTGFRPGNLNLGQEFNARQLGLAGDELLPDVPPFAGNPDGLTGNEAAALATSLVVYDGDDVINYELGLKTKFWEDRINLSVSAYYFDWSDTILTFSQDNLPTINKIYNDNAGAAHSTGIEAEIITRVTDRFTVRLVGDWNESELDEDFGVIEKGAILPFAPEWSTAVTLDYLFPVSGSWTVNGLVNFTAMAKQKNVLGDEDFKVPGRRQLDLRLLLGSPDDRWLATVFVNNVTKENEIVIADRRDSPYVNRFAYQRPRTIGVELTYDFR